MKEIILANNKGITIVDNEDYEWLNKYKWHLLNNKYARASIKINGEYVNLNIIEG